MEPELIEGRNGIFEVAVDGKVVARKTFLGFPGEEEMVREVQRAVQSGG